MVKPLSPVHLKTPRPPRVGGATHPSGTEGLLSYSQATARETQSGEFLSRAAYSGKHAQGVSRGIIQGTSAWRQARLPTACTDQEPQRAHLGVSLV